LAAVGVVGGTMPDIETVSDNYKQLQRIPGSPGTRRAAQTVSEQSIPVVASSSGLALQLINSRRSGAIRGCVRVATHTGDGQTRRRVACPIVCAA